MEPSVGRRSLGVDTAVLGMAIFLAAEAMLFAGLLSALAVTRAAAKAWPPPGQPGASFGVAALATLVLLASVRGVRSAQSAGEAGAGLLGESAGLGAVFLVVQGMEAARLVHAGLAFPSSTYAGLFAAIVGCHWVHVFVGVVLLLRALARWRGGNAADRTRVAVSRMYWYFVVAMWPAILAAVEL